MPWTPAPEVTEDSSASQQQQIKVFGTIELTQRRFIHWSFSGQMYFFKHWLNAKWLNENGGIQKYHLGAQGLPGKEVKDILRVLKHWERMAKGIDYQQFGVDFEGMRSFLERSLMDNLPAYDKLTFAVKLLKTIKYSNCFSPPNSTLVYNLEKMIDKEKFKKLGNFKVWFGKISLKLQTRALKLLAIKRRPAIPLGLPLNPFDDLILRVREVKAQLSKMQDSATKRVFIDDLMKSHHVKQQEANKKTRRDLYQRWTGDAPSAPLKLPKTPIKPPRHIAPLVLDASFANNNEQETAIPQARSPFRRLFTM